MPINGANQTPRISQCQMASVISSPGIIIHPRPSTTYTTNLTNHADSRGDESDSGSPNRTARAAAREKLSTVMIEITVDAKQRLSDLRREEIDATSLFGCGRISRALKGSEEVRIKRHGAST
jgi:hypothetical protein